MREIKFRGKSRYNKKWNYGNLIDCHDGDVYIAETYDVATFELVDPKTVGQYTGLKDKNGVEIYEGDIVERTVIDNGFGKFRSVVGYKDGGFVLNEEWGYAPFHDLFSSVYEVIGNIYDNPELLEVKE